MAVLNFNIPSYNGIESYYQSWFSPKMSQIGNCTSIDDAINALLIRREEVFAHDKLRQFNAYWEKEYDKYTHYVVGNQTDFKRNVARVNQSIVQIHFEDYEIELTPNNSVKYTLLLPDKKMLMITKSFNSYEDKTEKEVVFSIFENKKLILSDIKNLDELVTGINKYIGM